MFLFGENTITESCSEAMVFQELLKFPFISKIRVGFETQLMNTTKHSRTVSKIHSQGIRHSR